MSRKPTAVRLKQDPKNNSDHKSETKASSSNTKKATKPEAERSRRPVALAPPAAGATDDPFDIPPFVDDGDTVYVPPNHVSGAAKGIRWFAIFVSSVLALLTLAMGFWLQSLVEQFFAINPSLGWFATALVAIAGLALLGLLFREVTSLLRLRKLSGIRQDSEQVLLGNGKAKPVIRSIVALYAKRPDMRWHIDVLREYDDEILEDMDRMHLAERTLMHPLDAEAKQIIATSAKRVSLITALNPSPVLDILFVGFQVMQMLRKVMTLYGGKPALSGAVKLIRMIATHLAITGGLAITDTLLQQFVGKGLAGRLSTKLGEGTVNGIMATRIGLAAIDLCRPMPFAVGEKPSLSGFVKELFK